MNAKQSAGVNPEVISLLDDSDASVEVISLLDDSDQEGSGGPDGRSHHRETMADITNATQNAVAQVISGLEVMEVSTPAWQQVAPAAGNATEGRDDEDEELEIVATRGQNALADFPHCRANCAKHPFSMVSERQVHCDNCYCYVCDIPAAECKEWSSHCEASHEERRWRQERTRAKRAPAVRAAAAAGGDTAARRGDFSVRRLLEMVTGVYPVEMHPGEGRGFHTTLRHYQMQSLAFMVDTERNSKRGGWLCDEVGMGKSAVVLALVAANPPNPSFLATQQQISEALKKADAYDQQLVQVEIDCEAEILRLRGAYFKKIKEVATQHQEDLKRDFDKRIREVNKKKIERQAKIRSIVKLKPTVILTSVSLIGQWEDEIKKHAPGLNSKCFHPSRKKRDERNIRLDDPDAILGLNKVDIIVSTSTFAWPWTMTKFFEFHRVVHDESHLFSGSASANHRHANAITSPLRWAVTATPMATSPTDLSRQLQFIQGSAPSASFESLRDAINSFCANTSESTLSSLVGVLSTCMVRHTKSQQINGSAALSLPPSTTSTIMLAMSEYEDRAFNSINVKPSARFLQRGAQTSTVERYFAPQMHKVLHDSAHKILSEVFQFRRRYIPECLTKIVALRKDLAEHLGSDSQLRAVVFTHHVDIHEVCVRALKQDGFDVHEFNGRSSAGKRDAAIRDFQSRSSSKPSVFVITLRSGNVGITLTAASRVYLLEPALDPAVEVQAAGRIHRLGQEKPCQVVKFVFKNSYEENVVELHKKILVGDISIVDGFVPSEGISILARGLRFSNSENSIC